jgi:hypothetical protein
MSEQAGQTLNADLCFVPAMHQAEIKLPTVSGSSGKLVIQHPKREPIFADYPGAVFADQNLSYPGAMKQFVAASTSEVKLTDREIDIKTLANKPNSVLKSKPCAKMRKPCASNAANNVNVASSKMLLSKA